MQNERTLEELEDLIPGEVLYLKTVLYAGGLNESTLGRYRTQFRQIVAQILDQRRDRDAELEEYRDSKSAPARKGVPSRKGHTDDHEGPPGSSEERLRLFGKNLARRVSEHESVRLFRQSAFGGPYKTLAADAARGLLNSEALCYVSRNELQALGVPLDGSHRSTVDSLPAGGYQVTLKWPGHRVVETIAAKPGGRRVELPGHDSWVFAWQGSFLHELAETARFLRQICDGWSEPDVIDFLVSAKVPAMEPIRVEPPRVFDGEGPTSPYATIRVTPDSSAEDLAEAFLDMKFKLGLSARKTIGERNLTLLDFVESAVKRGESPDWADLMPTWNKLVPHEWRYEAPSLMRRDYEATARRVYLMGLTPAKVNQASKPPAA